ncbi:hypothetical protein KAJ83_15530 [Marivibrio halodurans]|uniref:DUF2946 domain-containing protein n=1 Tax=Marivibrio halodurans TaxID=2039722 RepID=A0A8J7V3W2_9PROT|nr:hypothetical protein [Marivibrio halodurans]MBP5858432.1 hypothetical protein [Marivibrio halodurans]
MIRSATSARRRRALTLLLVAWLSVLMPATAGVRIDVPNDPATRIAFAALCVTPGTGTPKASDDGPGGTPSADPQCFFCYPGTHGAAAVQAPCLAARTIIHPDRLAWIDTGAIPPVSRKPHAPRARGPPTVLS